MSFSITRIAFVGLGTMGQPMAARLLDADYEVVGYDQNPNALRELTERGALKARSAHEAAEHADLVITMLPNGPHVQAATSGADGALCAMRPGSLLVDMSTIDPETSTEVCAEAAARGVRMLDAPVSGSSAGALDGTLTIMVGGPVDSLEAARPVLSVLGRRIVHCGPNGSGVAVKLANQIMAGASMAAVAEGFVLAERLGLDPRLLFEVASASSGNCWSLQTRPPVAGVLDTSPAEKGFAPGFMGALMCKDLDLALATARTNAVDLPLTRQARDLYARMSAAGIGELDFSAVFTVLRGSEADSGADSGDEMA